MLNALSPNLLLSNLEQAERDLAFYTAIVGHRPKVTAAAETPEVAPAPAPPAPIPAEHQPGRMSIWMHHVSIQAKRRINEARMRLAS